jgi:curli production assembly/transport component CsgE
MKLILCSVFLLLLGFYPVSAQNFDDTGVIESEDDSLNNSLEIEIDGLVIDNTKTKIGRDFYGAFYKGWIAPRGAKDFSIKVVEKPGRGRGSQILILVNELLVVNRYLQPQPGLIEATADQSIAQVRNFLQNYESIQQQLNNDDQAGNGIY